MSGRIIEADRSIVFSPDIDPDEFAPMMAKLGNIAGLGGVKLGTEVGLGLSLRTATDAVREADPNLIVIYDHQKAATDIDNTGVGFARTMARGTVDAAILFPFTGPVTQESYTRELQQKGIKVISGGEMTHKGLMHNEGGYFGYNDFFAMYRKAIQLDVRDFVVPGNKPLRVEAYRKFMQRELGDEPFTLWAPGFITQGGDLSETGQLAGDRFHAIVGSGIYGAEDPRQAATDLGQKILSLGEVA